MIALVSREALVSAVLDAVAVLDRMGGSFSVHVGRRKTGFPGEAVTTNAVVLWTSGPRARPEPEADTDVIDETPAAPAAGQEELVGDEPDGVDLSTLDVEDDSSIPAAAR